MCMRQSKSSFLGGRRIMEYSTKGVNVNLSEVDWLSIKDITEERNTTSDTEISRLVAEYLITLRGVD